MGDGDVYRVTLEHSYADAGVAVQHVLWFQQTSVSPVGDEAEILARAVGNAWLTAGGAIPRWIWSPAFLLTAVRGQKMLFDFEPPVTVSPEGTTAGVGTDYGGGVPTVCSLVMTLLAERGGRSGRGRIYMGGFASRKPNNPGFWAEYITTVNHAHWNNEMQANIQAWMNAFSVQFNGSTVVDEDSGLQAKWGVWSRKIGGSNPPFAVEGFSPMIGHLTDGVIRVQRRREYGHGI
jgi:hypothetical protein